MVLGLKDLKNLTYLLNKKVTLLFNHAAIHCLVKVPSVILKNQCLC